MTAFRFSSNTPTPVIGLDAAQRRAIAVDSTGAAYVTGSTDSTDFNTVGQIESDSASNDTFISKLTFAQPSPPPPPPPTPTPSSDISFPKVTRNEHKGTAKLTVKVPGPGKLELAKTRKVKPDSATEIRTRIPAPRRAS